jgi:hypothetical protein
VISSASLDRTRRYRYRLRREWQPSPRRVTFIMLNPSTADARVLDPTIRRCIGFAKAWGFGGIDVVNLFAWRSTRPEALWRVDDPVGPRNHAAIASAMRESSLVVAAWGNAGRGREQAVRVCRLAGRLRAPLYCLGTTLSGQPRHPLYVSAVTALEGWLAPPAPSLRTRHANGASHPRCQAPRSESFRIDRDVLDALALPCVRHVDDAVG